MFDLDRWNEIYSTIKKHKLRTILTAFGVGWGIFMLIAMMGAGKGLQNGVEHNFDIAKNAVFVWSRRTSEPYMGLKAGRYIRFENNDIDAIRANVPEVDVLSPRNRLGGDFTVNYKEKNAAFEVFGDYPDFMRVEPITISKGRFINNFDIRDKRKVAIVGEQIVKTFFEEEENPLGKFIEIKGVYFQIVGVFKPRGDAEEVARESKVIHLPHTTMQQAFNQINQIYWFAFTPKEGVPAKFIEERIKVVLAKKHKVAPNDLKAFGSANVEEEYKQIQNVFTFINLFSWFVSILTIFAGVVGVSNIMLIVVRERTKEIGIRKALGATPWSITSLIMQETIVITAVAGYFGLLVGVGMIEGINYLMNTFELNGSFFRNPEININVAIGATLTLVIFGALASLIPASQAARVRPVVALKDE